MANESPQFDIAIVGGGPAGLSAAIWSARYGHRVLVVDGGEPRNWETRGINGYLGLPSVLPADLRARGRAECELYGVTFANTDVMHVEPDDGELLRLQLKSRTTYIARRVLLAIGICDVWPDIPGLEDIYGTSAHVCPDCDGYDVRGKRVVVIGNGRRAVGMALALTTWTSDIIICTNGSPAEMEDTELREKLDACQITVRTESVEHLDCEGRQLRGLLLSDGTQLSADKLFFTLAQVPADDLGARLGCERDSGGRLVVSEHYATSVMSVFAAGDITAGPQLAIRAAAAGAVAAMAMHRSLLPEHRKLAS